MLTALLSGGFMSCKNCQQSRLMDKLGRCQACLVKSAAFCGISLLGLLVNQQTGADPIMQLTCLAGSLLFGGLFGLHLFYRWTYRRQGRAGRSIMAHGITEQLETGKAQGQKP